MSGTNPKVSVIMPAHNAARFIRKSVESALDQSYGNVELVVVDDGSSDGTVEELGRFKDRIKFLKQTNRGPSAARNKALEIATGEYVCFLDADDVLCPGAIDAFMTRALERPEIDVVVGRWDVIDEMDRPASDLQEAESRVPASKDGRVKAFLIATCWPIFAAMSRMDAVRKCGGWDETLWCAEDRDLWLRLVLAGSQLDFIPCRVARYRKHPTNSTRNVAKMEEHLLRFLDKWFARRAPIHEESASIKPYAYGLGWLYLAQQAQEAGLEGEMRRCVQKAIDFLATTQPDDELTQRVLWDAYEKPWEREIHSALWDNSRTGVAELCWVHGRQALRRHEAGSAIHWFMELARNHPGHFATKLRRLIAG